MTRYYDTDRAAVEYILFHYAPDDVVLPYDFGPKDALHFPTRVVQECVDVQALPEHARALDLGCAVGGSSFELARTVSEVVGLDASSQFIEIAQRMQREKQLEIEYPINGIHSQRVTVSLPSHVHPERVRFVQGDAMALPLQLGQFDVVLMANVIDRLPDPGLCLQSIHRFVKPGGQLVITSPYTWLEEYTPRSKWLDGLEEIQAVLTPFFEFKGRKDMPFLIREHARKFQWSVAEASMWTRRNK